MEDLEHVRFKLKAVLPEHGTEVLCFSLRNGVLASADCDMKVHIRDAAVPEQCSVLETEGDCMVALSGDASTLLQCGPDTGVKLLQIGGKPPHASATVVHEFGISCPPQVKCIWCCVTYKGDVGFVVCEDQKLRKLDLVQGSVLGSADSVSSHFCVNCTPNGEIVAVGSMADSLLIFNGLEMQRLKDLKGHRRTISSLNFLQKSSTPVDPKTGAGWLLLSSSWDHTCRVWDIENSSCLKVLPHTTLVTFAAFLPNARFIVTTDEASMRLWDTTNEEEIAVVGRVHNGSGACCVTVHPDLPHVITGGYDGNICYWELPSSIHKPAASSAATAAHAASAPGSATPVEEQGSALVVGPEAQLSDEQFKEILGVTRQDFAELPASEQAAKRVESKLC
eukprot:NODE_522_length_1401_cov_107.642072_g487_i0.p1 GENE.NODE_522_length_1401_cov_107.642072_g487_i0~~NODE_522_length_1401_cov_107.642072_g487_i0.p1  ORF type:complete len:393 (-),score=50.72 NODE_522_length_1401_cov_107.642072_g487_i0:161-1339(-)